MKYNYQLIIEYDGTNFVGWQFQKNGISIQETIELNLKKIFKKKDKNNWSWKDRQRRTCFRSVR